jgi:hypothetical protein
MADTRHGELQWLLSILLELKQYPNHHTLTIEQEIERYKYLLQLEEKK